MVSFLNRIINPAVTVWTSSCAQESSLMLRLARILWAAVLVVLAALLTGCRDDNLVRVTGQVVENGEPVRLASGESIQIDFLTADGAYPPLALGVYAKPDGSFAVDMNDGTGRGLPPGKYKVHLNRESTSINKKVNPQLFKKSVVLEFEKGVSLHITVDLAKGTISP
jgi:hypothetical protein